MRVLLLSVIAAILAGCAAANPLLPAPDMASTPIAESDPPAAAEQITEAEQPTGSTQTPAAASKTPPKRAVTPRTSPKPASASHSSSKTAFETSTTTMAPVTPTVSSAEWQKERAEDERKERHIKEVIEGICRGC